MSEQESEQAHTGRAKSRGRILDWTEAGLWIVLLVVGSLVALAVLRDSEGRNRTRAAAKPAPGGLIEAEDLPVIAKSREFTFWLQPSDGFPAGKWSKDGHMFASGTSREIGSNFDCRSGSRAFTRSKFSSRRQRTTGSSPYT